MSKNEKPEYQMILNSMDRKDVFVYREAFSTILSRIKEGDSMEELEKYIIDRLDHLNPICLSDGVELSLDNLSLVEKEKLAGIYYIKCLKNGKKYIGASEDMLIRFRIHSCSLRREEHHNPSLQEDYNRYGSELFCIGIIELFSDPARLREKEALIIDSIEHKLKYNFVPKCIKKSICNNGSDMYIY